MTSLTAEAVIDASVLLAFLKEESVFASELEDLLPHAFMSSVNYCEVATVLGSLGMPLPTIKKLVGETVEKLSLLSLLRL